MLIKQFESIKELEDHKKAEKLHETEYDNSFKLVWGIIEKKTMGAKMARIAMRIVSSHIGGFLYYYNKEDGQSFIKAYMDLLSNDSRDDELEVFSTKFLDSQSRYAEAIYQLYIEACIKKREDEVINAIRSLFFKLSLCPVLEIITISEEINEKSPTD